MPAGRPGVLRLDPVPGGGVGQRAAHQDDQWRHGPAQSVLRRARIGHHDTRVRVDA